VAVFRPGAARALAEFTTARAQILNQSPELTKLLTRGPDGAGAGAGHPARSA
jgi:hypothetical protein